MQQNIWLKLSHRVTEYHSAAMRILRTPHSQTIRKQMQMCHAIQIATLHKHPMIQALKSMRPSRMMVHVST